MAYSVADAPTGEHCDRTGRHETVDERYDRRLEELLQEFRVAGLGVQVLFGFLLALPFTVRFVKLSQTQRDVYLASLLCAAVAIVLLVGPVAFHRLVFRRHEKGLLVRTANTMAIAGLVSVAAAVTCAITVVVSFVAHGWPVPVMVLIVAAGFGGIWFVLPLASRAKGEPTRRH